MSQSSGGASVDVGGSSRSGFGFGFDGFSRAMLAVVAVASCAVAVKVWSGGAVFGPAQAQAQVAPNGGILSSTEQRRLMILELQAINERVARIEAAMAEDSGGE